MLNILQNNQIRISLCYEKRILPFPETQDLHTKKGWRIALGGTMG